LYKRTSSLAAATKNQKTAKMTVWENPWLGDVRLSVILPWCLENCGVDTLLVTSHQSFGKSGKGMYYRKVDTTTRKLVGEKLITSFEARGWPGIKLTNHKGRVYISEFDAQLSAKMAEVQNSLFKWLNVDLLALPEDICVFRRGAKLPTLISVTHERQAWVIAEKCPPGFTASTFAPEDLYIWPGKYFCRI
jgi:hypothetical protein